MGHGRGALLARIERLFGLQHLGALQVADLDRHPLDGGGDHGQGGEIGGVAVPRNHLRRDRLDLQPHLLGDVGLHPGIDVRKGADGAGNGADRDLLAGADQPLAAALELRVVAGELDAKGRRLGVDAVAAAHRRGQLVLDGAALQGRQHQVDAADQEIGGPGQLHAEAGVQHVRGRHALVQEPGFRSDDFGDVRQEGDDVVLGDLLDLVDPVGVPDRVLALLPDGLGGQLRDGPDLGHRFGGVGLDLEHDVELGLRRPDGGRLGSGVAGDHQA